MSKHYFTLLLALLLSFTGNIFSQVDFILAGHHTFLDYYYDIPDTTFQTQPKNTLEYYFDANRDGVDDFKFVSYHSSNAANWVVHLGVNVQPLQGELKFDTLGIDHVSALNYSDTISNTGMWVSTNQKISYYYNVQCPPICPGDTGSVNTNVTDRYIGFRLFGAGDTVYGWIRFDVQGFSMTIKEWAIKSASGVMTNYGPEVFPIPANTILYIEAGGQNEIYEVILYDLLGKKVMESVSSQGQSQFILDISSLGSDVYFVKIIAANGIVTKKVVIQN